MWGIYYLIKHPSKKEDPEKGQRQEHVHFKIHLDDQKTLISYVLPSKKFEPSKKTYLIYLGRFDVESALARGTILEKGILDTLHGIIDSPFARITYTEAIQILEKSKQKFDFPVKWGIDLQSEHEKYLTEQHIKKPTIVIDYPKEIKSFYMYKNDDEKTVRAMDILVPKIGEIIGGSQREDRSDVLKQRIEEASLPLQPYWWYLELRDYGSVPHAGFGLGFERFIQFMTGMKNIRDTIPFPRVPGHAEF